MIQSTVQYEICNNNKIHFTRSNKPICENHLNRLRREQTLPTGIDSFHVEKEGAYCAVYISCVRGTKERMHAEMVNLFLFVHYTLFAGGKCQEIIQAWK